MNTTMLNRTIGGVDDTRAVLLNSEAKRTLSAGSTWTKCRLGIRCCINAGSSITSPILAMGLCTAITDGYGRDSTYVVGVRFHGASLDYTAGPPAYLAAHSASDWTPFTKIVGAITDGSTVTSSAAMVASAPTTNRSCLFVEITKGTPNWTFQFGAPTTAAAVQTDISIGDFNVEMQYPDWATYALSSWLSGYNIGSPVTLAVSEATYGYLITPIVYWNQSSTTLEISDLIWSRLA